jgi:hypothetical protein
MNTQKELLDSAKNLADLGEDYGIIVGDLGPEEKLWLKNYVLNLPEELARKTIYGRNVWNNRVDVPRGRGRPKKY